MTGDMSKISSGTQELGVDSSVAASNDGEELVTDVPVIASIGAAAGLVFVIVGLILLRRRRNSKNGERSSRRSPSDALESLGSEKQCMQGDDGSWKSHGSASKSHLNMDDHNHNQENEASGRSNSVVAAVDPTTGKTYYHNIVTDKTAWTAEEASRGHGQNMGRMNDDYEHAAASMARTTSVTAAVDPNSGKTYYHNTITDKTAWSASEASRKYGQVTESFGVNVTEVKEEVFHNPMFIKNSVKGSGKTLEPKKSATSMF
jgi:hypothetical protein